MLTCLVLTWAHYLCQRLPPPLWRSPRIGIFWRVRGRRRCHVNFTLEREDWSQSLVPESMAPHSKVSEHVAAAGDVKLDEWFLLQWAVMAHPHSARAHAASSTILTTVDGADLWSQCQTSPRWRGISGTPLPFVKRLEIQGDASFGWLHTSRRRLFISAGQAASALHTMAVLQVF